MELKYDTDRGDLRLNVLKSYPLIYDLNYSTMESCYSVKQHLWC